jgi:molecular chaperone GrpE
MDRDTGLEGAAEGEEAAEESIEGELRRRAEEFNLLAEERLEQLMRCRAELENTLKIVAREREEHAKYASERLISKILPFLDSLEQASKHDEGAKALHQQLSDILRSEGLEPIESVGKKFDPYKHEALMQVRAEDLEEDTVAHEIQKGYLLHSRVIRFSKVSVVRQ